jgi:hypothetical protein
MTVDFHLAQPRPQAPLEATSFHEWTFADGTLWTRFYHLEAGYLLRFPEIADFYVAQDGLQVEGWPVAGVSDATLQHLYLNQVLPLALSKQGKLVLHASAVEIDGEGVAFIGESGRGKSTLAASFATSGFRFLTDDGLLVEPDGEKYQILPSHPSIRLWQDSEEALVAGAAQKAPAVEFTSKSRFLAGGGIAFCGEPRRLRRVYFLGEGSGQARIFERMAPSTALIELVKHSFLLDIKERELLVTHFDELSGLASQPIFYRLDYPRRFEDLPQVRQAIIEHTQQENDAA